MIYANNKPINVIVRGKRGTTREMSSVHSIMPALTVWAWCGK